MPTIITRRGSVVIGLGGTGVQVLNAVKRNRLTRLFYGENDNVNVEYIAIYSGVNDLTHNIGFWKLKDNELFQISQAAAGAD